MTVSRKKRKKPKAPARMGRARTMGPKVKTPVLPPSLPPVATPDGAVAESSTQTLSARPTDRTQASWYLPDDSKVRPIALQAIAMRIAGMEDDEIAAALNISPKSISPYIYRAGKNGWLDIDDPKARMDYQLMHKVVRNLDQGLDSSDPGIRQETTMEMAKGTIFKRYGEVSGPVSHQTVVAVRIEMPQGVPIQQMREDTTGGVPAYLDVEVVK